MEFNRNDKWLKWAREIHALAQTGLTFSTTVYETDRNKRLLAIAAQIIEEHTGLAAESITQNFSNHLGYATPKIDVRAAIIENNRILLVKEKSDGCWSMPGGWADVGESPSEMIIREVYEEAGLNVTPVKVLAVFDANRDAGALQYYHAYKIIFMCVVTGGVPSPGEETSAAEYFEFFNLPELSPNRTTKRHIEEIIEHIKNPARPAAFD